MKVEALKCPQCGADLNIAENRDFYSCDHCGSRLRVDRRSGGGTRLTQFEVLLRRTVTQTRFLAAGERLQILRGELAAASQCIEEARASVEALGNERRALEAKLKSSTQEKLGQMAVLALLAAGALFLTFRSIGGDGAFWWLLVAASSSFGVWYTYRQSDALKRDLARQIMAVDAKRDVAQAEFDKAEADRLDLALEAELCERTRANFRLRADDDSDD